MSIKYDEYLAEHKHNVYKGFLWLVENLPDLFEEEYIVNDINHQISFEHDYSKSNADEYTAYDNYFYGNKSFEVVQEFNKAWLKHIHRNPHHWQYWVLIKDDPNEENICIDMDYNYIIEMICDWWSFSWKKGNLYEIFDWYEQRKQHILLSDNTRKTVEDILEKIRTKLDEEKETE